MLEYATLVELFIYRQWCSAMPGEDCQGLEMYLKSMMDFRWHLESVRKE